MQGTGPPHRSAAPMTPGIAFGHPEASGASPVWPAGCGCSSQPQRRVLQPIRRRYAAFVIERVTQPGPSDRIGRVLRVVAWVLGLSALGGGATGAFAGDLEAPPVALLAVGTIFVLVGMSGQLPRRLKFGDSEAEWERTVASAVREIAEQVPPARLDRIAGALEELATVAPHAAANVANHVIRGQARIDSLRNVAARLGIRVGESDTVNARTSDLTLVDLHGKKLWVIFSTTGVRQWQIGSAREIMEEIKQTDTAYVGVLLLGARRQESSELRSTNSGAVWVVEMGEDMDERELERVVTAAFGDGRHVRV